MPRKKLSEFRAKTLLYAALGQQYKGWEIDLADDNWQSVIDQLDNDQQYVIKIDQAEKGRFKKGLVKLDRPAGEVINEVKVFKELGYRYVLVEQYQSHRPEAERYLSLERTRAGIQLSFSKSGGVDVEDQIDEMVTTVYDGSVPVGIDVPAHALQDLVQAFEDNYLSFLEINPLLVTGESVTLLDAATEVDSEAVFFEDGWNESDIRRPLTRPLTAEEVAVEELASQSQASFSLEVINPNGAIFVLLSGGGASVVVADEVTNLGYGEQLANYGEYSGNPNFEETRLYTEQIVKLLLASNAPQKVLIIGGGVANFTDIRVTFKGVVAGLQPYEAELKQQQVMVFVRRGGPYEKEGLATLKAYLDQLGIAGTVAGPELLLSDIVKQAVRGEA